MVDAQAVASLPVSKGAYALVLRIPGRVEVTVRTNAHALPAGWYVYVGSARGPGGLRARLARHFRADRKPHWHVDALTAVANRLYALALVAGSECEVVRCLAELPATSFPIAGFGSSDCADCRAHLLRWHARPDAHRT
ncbi:MAG: GIY-YIG nuclease family protein [Pseudomonadales bacterium]